jgi:hypothetical protein
MLFWPALARQRPRSRRSAELARDRAANPVKQRAIRQYIPARMPKLRAKTTVSTASDQLHQHSRRRQFPIAPAAPSVPRTPRFRALALFGRRPSERVDGLGIPASENLHMSRRQPLPRISKVGLVLETDPRNLISKFDRGASHETSAPSALDATIDCRLDHCRIEHSLFARQRVVTVASHQNRDSLS